MNIEKEFRSKLKGYREIYKASPNSLLMGIVCFSFSLSFNMMIKITPELMISSNILNVLGFSLVIFSLFIFLRNIFQYSKNIEKKENLLNNECLEFKLFLYYNFVLKEKAFDLEDLKNNILEEITKLNKNELDYLEKNNEKEIMESFFYFKKILNENKNIELEKYNDLLNQKESLEEEIILQKQKVGIKEEKVRILNK